MIQILSDYPVLLLFVVASLGYLIGTIKIKGSSLGVAAVLFTGLFFGAISPELQIPEIIFVLGLCIFVYSIGLNSGPAFFDSFRKNGLRDFGFILSMLLFSGLIACLLWWLLGFSAATITGIYAGSTTNTAALAGVIDYITANFSDQEASVLVQDAVIGYTYSYPMGVLGGIIAIVLMEKGFRINYEKEKKQLRKIYPLENKLTSTSVCITNPNVCKTPLRDLLKQYDWDIQFGRIYRNGEVGLVNWDTTFKVDDLVMFAGNEEDIASVLNVLGEKSNSLLEYDRREFDARRIFVSNSQVVGRSIASLNLSKNYNATITRIRRGDIDMLATGETVLQLGDRIRFIARREDLAELSALFGDSYHAAGKVNLFSFGLGIGLGLVLGTIQIPIGSNFSFNLGYAGGPLIVGLILGALRRTGPIVWSLPYSANVTLNQLGLMLLLSTIGVRSGNAFIQSISTDGLLIFGASAVISLFTAIAILLVGYRFMKKPFSFLMEVVSNQPAILDFATTKSKNRIPEFGFALMFPIALISKILIAQLLFLFLN